HRSAERAPMQLKITAVSLAFGDRELFRDLHLRAAGPACVALMGPSGAGKSTLLGVIAGELPPDRGEVSFFADGASVHPRIAWVLQSSPVMTRRSVLDNVLLGAWDVPLSLEQAKLDASRWLATLNIEHLSQQRAKRASGGERQRIAIARGMLSDADVLLVDEPTASLDLVSRGPVVDALHKARDAGALVIVATHDSYVADRCDEVFHLDDRMLVSLGGERE
ncbi:ATP-binding cassette domain-containing protein, partial [Microbacterium sp.]|uniref:ATP-binding cassette domain-containing protein n=1 Tax=Microbacterium sp. TaxID=51671 RepID=UPI0027334555